jgi:hypothetical protein
MRSTPHWRERVDEIFVTGSAKACRSGEPIDEVMTFGLMRAVARGRVTSGDGRQCSGR